MNLHKQFLKLAKEKQNITYKLLALLPEIYSSKIYKKYAGSIEGYAYRFAGIPESTVRKTLNLNKIIEIRPKLKSLVKQVGVHKVATVATLINDQNEDVMIEKVKNMSLSALSSLAKECRGAEKVELINLKLNQKQKKLLDLVKKKIDPNLLVEDLIQKLCESYLVNESSIITDTKSDQTQTRYIPNKTKLKIVKEYNGLCAFGSCRNKSAELHHQIHFAKSNTHNQLVPLCKEHHQFMHNNLVSNSEKDPAFWEIQLKPTINKIDLKYNKMRQNYLK